MLDRAEESRRTIPGLDRRTELDTDWRFTGSVPDLITGSRRAVKRSVSDFRAMLVFCESVGLATMLRVGFERNTELRVGLERNTELRVGLERNTELREVEVELDNGLVDLVVEEDEELGLRMMVEDRDGTVLRRVMDGLLEDREVVGTERRPVTIRLEIELRLEEDEVEGLRGEVTDRVIGDELGLRIWLEDLLWKEDDGLRLILMDDREELSERDVLAERDCNDCL